MSENPASPPPGVAPAGQAIITKQPLPVMKMSATDAGGNRNVNNIPRDAMGQRKWSFGLCGCFNDCRICMCGLCCPCILYARIKQRLEYLNLHAKPDPKRGGDGIDSSCLVYFFIQYFTCSGYILLAINRGQIRNRYLIDGNGCGDFCTACCCTVCEFTRQHRELELEENSLRQ